MQHACLMICNVLSISISICYSCFMGVRMCCLLAFDRFSNPSSRIHETVELVTDVVDKNGLDKKCWMLQTQLYVNHSFLYSGEITSRFVVRLTRHRYGDEIRIKGFQNRVSQTCC